MPRWSSWVLGAAVGAFVAILVANLTSVTIDTRVNLADLISILVTLGLTILVAVYGQKHFSDVRAEKDLLIEQAAEAIRRAREVDRLLSQYQMDQSNWRILTDTIDSLGADLSDLQRLSEHGEVVEPDLDDVQYSLIRYRLTVTGGDFPTEKLTAQNRSMAESINRHMVGALQQYIMDVNYK